MKKLFYFVLLMVFITPGFSAFAEQSLPSKSDQTQENTFSNNDSQVQQDTKSNKLFKNPFKRKNKSTSPKVPTWLLIVLAIFIPPLAVFLAEGIGLHFWINLILYVLVFSWPIAIIHAIWRILT